MSNRILLPVIIFLVVLAGCSNKVRIGGTVTFEDGQPLVVGSVCFRNDKITYTGFLDKQGRYRIGEMKDGDGIPPGTYQVWLTGTEEEKVKLLPDGRAAGFTRVSHVNRKYTAPESSGLSFEVKNGGTKTFSFMVSKP
ncbi:hypothetical protein FACS189427_12140 [Planctomycetales bacterium]|nr:hypothetical protein FACS189427_12140 [Planctomycetales bacterium]